MNCLTTLKRSDEPPQIKHSNNLSCNFKTYGFAITIIIGIGGLAIIGVGLGSFGAHQGWWQAGALSNLGQINLIIMMTVGGGGGISFLIVGIVCSIKNHQKKHSISSTVPDLSSSPKDLQNIKILLENDGKSISTNLAELHEVAENYIPADLTDREAILKNIHNRLNTKEFQKNPLDYVNQLTTRKPKGEVEQRVLGFFCALLRDFDTNRSFPWNMKG